MSAIKPDDLFPFDEYQARLKQIETGTESLAQSLVGMISRIKSAYGSAQQEVEGLADQLQHISITQKEASAIIGDYAGKVNKATSNLENHRQAYNNLTDAQEANQKIVSDLNTKLAGLHQRYKELDPTQKGYEKQQKAILREVNTVTRAIDAQSKTLKIGKTAADAIEGSYQHLQTKLTSLRRELREMPDAFDLGTGALNRQNKAAVDLVEKIQRADAAIKKMDSLQGQFGRNVGNYPKGMAAGFGADFLSELANPVSSLMSGAGLAAGLATLASGIVSVRAEYERLEKQLETTLGNQGAAAEAQAMIAEFARKTPREVAEVTRSFNRLVDVGIIPTEKELYNISDIAQAKGKDMIDYVEAIADAQQGEFERLKEFGINASKTGDQVIFTFKGQQTAVKFTTEAINDYLISLGNVKGVAGQTEEAGKTLSGQWATLGETFKGIANIIGEFLEPALKSAISLGQRWADKMLQNFRDVQVVYQQQGLLSAASLFVAPFGAQDRINAARQSQKEEDYRSGKTRDAEQGDTGLGLLRKQQEEQNKKNEAARKAREAADKARKEADKVLRENLSKSQSSTSDSLTDLGGRRQQGLIDEQTFIEERLKITLAGLNERQALLEKAGKKETDDYINVQKEKKKADQEYRDSQLQLDLKSAQTSTSSKVSALGVSHNDGTLTDLQFVEQKRAAQIEGVQQQQRILEDAGQKESQLYKDLNTELLNIDKDYFKERAEVHKKEWKMEQVETVKALERIEQAAAQNLSTRLQQIEKAYDDEEAAIQLSVAKREITEEEGQRRITQAKIRQLQAASAATQAAYDTVDELVKSSVQRQIDEIEKFKNASGRTATEVADADKAIAKLKEDRDNKLAENAKNRAKEVGDYQVNQNKQSNQQQVKDTEAAEIRKQQLIQKTFDTIGGISYAYFSYINSVRQADLDNLTKQRDNEVALAGDNAEAKKKIEENYDKKQREIKKKQAFEQRAQAIFSIMLNTASAVVGTLAQIPPPAGIPFAVLTGVLGAAQLAAALAAPMPAFWTGTTNAPEGYALVGDRGPELRQKKDGSYQYYDRPTVDWLNKGDTIYTADQTKRIIDDWQRQEVTRQALQDSALLNAATGKLREGRLDEMRLIMGQSGQSLNKAEVYEAFGRALDERPVHETIIDAEGQHEGYRKGQAYIEYIEKRRLF